MKNLLAKAIALASTKFENTLDKGGHPYILHCIRVMDGVKDKGTIAMIAGILHDVVEDTDVTPDDLRNMGFPDEVLTVLCLLTHDRSVPYMDYIKALSVHPIATAVKKADLRDNTDIFRLKGLRKKDFERLEKYHYAYEYLKDLH